jgi:hypothetical protein
MECLTEKELEGLLENRGVRVGEYGLDYSESDKHLIVSLPEKVTSLNVFSRYIADWLLDGKEGIIYLFNWGQMDISHPIAIFEKLRNAYGESRDLREAPVHLFDITNEREKAVMTGMMFLVMVNDWDGYFLTRFGNKYIHTSDEFLLFSSDSDAKIDDAYEMTDGFNLRRRERWVGKFMRGQPEP